MNPDSSVMCKSFFLIADYPRHTQGPRPRPSGHGAPMAAARTASGSSMLAFRSLKMAAVACNERLQIRRSRGKCSASSTNRLDSELTPMSSPSSLAACKVVQHSRYGRSRSDVVMKQRPSLQLVGEPFYADTSPTTA